MVWNSREEFKGLWCVLQWHSVFRRKWLISLHCFVNAELFEAIERQVGKVLGHTGWLSLGIWTQLVLKKSIAHNCLPYSFSLSRWVVATITSKNKTQNESFDKFNYNNQLLFHYQIELDPALPFEWVPYLYCWTRSPPGGHRHPITTCDISKHQNPSDT